MTRNGNSMSREEMLSLLNETMSQLAESQAELSRVADERDANAAAALETRERNAQLSAALRRAVDRMREAATELEHAGLLYGKKK